MFKKRDVKGLKMLKSFISELKRRNVFKVATAYAIAGWIIIQIVVAIKAPLSLPDWFDTAIIVLVLIGFPIALIIAWAFELTPEGIKSSNDVDITESVTASTGNKLNRVIIAALSLAVILLVVNKLFYTQSIDSVNPGIASIAVLPFADMSPQGDQEHFSDGLSEELLNVLAKVKDMKVAGRTSSFKYKGVNDDLKKIGNELGVDHILEGSVRKAGNNIRVTAQLIKVDDGFHMWTETYDKKYSAENIFQIQDEISHEVLKELKVKLLGVNANSETKKIPTQNTDAYEAYLKGLQLSRNFQPKEIKMAIEHFKNAITLDPKFSLAYSHLALAYDGLVYYGNLNREEAADLIKNNADKALLLDDASGMANTAVALSFFYQRKIDKANEAVEKAYALEPNNPIIILFYADVVINDNTALKTELIEKAYGIDPLSPLTIEALGWNYYDNENYEKAQELMEKNVAINPDYVSAHRNLVRLLRLAPYGQLDEAFISAYKAYKQFPENSEVISELAYMAVDLHLYAVVDDLAEKMTLLYPENAGIIFIKNENYFHENDLLNYVKTLEELLAVLNVKQDENDKVDLRMQAFYYSGKIDQAINYIKTTHPIYLSDSISSIPNDDERGFLAVAAILKHSGDIEQANRLTEIYCDEVTSKFEHNGDLKKEKRNILNNYVYCAGLSDNGKLTAEIGEELYFHRNDKASTYDGFLNNIVSDLISDTPEFKALDTRITEDVYAMRDNAIAFLKAEGVWTEGKKD